VYGVAAASAAGMRGFGYAGGVTSADRLREAAPDAVVFDEMKELPSLLSVTAQA
jgi:beta-phosphoglucomutase-like phosphatase (HAD superfamily)